MNAPGEGYKGIKGADSVAMLTEIREDELGLFVETYEEIYKDGDRGKVLWERLCDHYGALRDINEYDKNQVLTFLQYKTEQIRGLKDPGHYLSVDDKGHATLHIKPFADDLVATYHFKTLKDTKEILFYNDGLYHFNGESVIETECERVFKGYTTNYNVNEIIGHVKRSGFVDRDALNTEKWVINLKNGLLNIKTREFNPHTHEYLTTIHIPVKYDPRADCPEIRTFLSEILFKKDIPTVEEMIGYCLYPDYIFQYWFLLHGEGDNGKSTFLSLLTHFLGSENIAAIGLQNLNQRFATMGLFAKLANIVADLSSQDLKQTHNLKALTGGDIVTAEPKFKNPFTFVNHAKLIYSCNQIPLSEDKSRAFYRRVFYIAFPNIFTGDRVDRTILKKLTTDEELSGLLNVAIAGLTRLLENGDFTGSVAVEKIREKYERASNPVYGFLNDWCILNSKDHISKTDLYAGYCDFCEENGFVIFTETKFVEVMKTLTKMEEARRGPTGSRRRVWLGLRLKTDDERKKEEKIKEKDDDDLTSEFSELKEDEEKNKNDVQGINENVQGINENVQGINESGDKNNEGEISENNSREEFKDLEYVHSVHTLFTTNLSGEEKDIDKVGIKLSKTMDTPDTPDIKTKLDVDNVDNVDTHPFPPTLNKDGVQGVQIPDHPEQNEEAIIPIEIRENVCSEEGECNKCHAGEKWGVNLPYIVHYSNHDFKTVCKKCGEKIAHDFNLVILHEHNEQPNGGHPIFICKTCAYSTQNPNDYLHHLENTGHGTNSNGERAERELYNDIIGGQGED